MHPGRGPFVVVAGIPGAGKTTAIGELVAGLPDDALLVLDSDSVRRSLQPRLPGIPYRVLRPVVHTVHWARIAVIAVTDARPLLVHATATWALPRAVLLRICRVARRPARMVWIDVDAATARQGQVARDRVTRAGAFGRHVQRVGRRDPAIAARPRWDAVARTDRAGAVAALRTATGAGTSTPDTGPATGAGTSSTDTEPATDPPGG